MKLTHVICRRMHYYAWLITGFFILCFIQSCKKGSEVDPGFGPNGEPRILSIHIADVPDQNIQLDQNLKQIMVSLPTSFSGLDIRPTYQLTPSTTITNTSNNYLLPESGSTGPTLILATDTKITNTYRYVFKPSGDLYFAKTATPISYTVTKDNGNNDGPNYACFLVYNYVDSVGASSLILTNKQTGKQLTFKQPGDRYCVTARYRDGAVIVRALFDPRTYYQPGEYIVELVKVSGRRAVLDQPFLVQRGIPTLYIGENYNRPILLGGPAYDLPGANILQEDKLMLRLRSRNQDPITVQPRLLASRPGVQLPSLTGISPGYYYAQLVLNGVEVPSYIRLVVLANTDDVAITYFYSVDDSGQHPLLDPAVSQDTPLTLNYGSSYQVQANKSLSDLLAEKKVPRIRLTSQADPSKAFYLSINLENTGLLDYNVFKVPTTVPAGRYQLTYQLVSPDQSIINTLPFERDVAVQ